MIEENFYTPLHEFLLRISPYSVRMQENTDQKNSEYGYFSHSTRFIVEWLLRGLNVRAKHELGFI